MQLVFENIEKQRFVIKVLYLMHMYVINSYMCIISLVLVQWSCLFYGWKDHGEQKSFISGVQMRVL